MDRLAEIFKRQQEYCRSLAAAYQSNGLFDYSAEMPWSLDSRVDQEHFRLLAWRITEEITEAVEYHEMAIDHKKSWASVARGSASLFREEVADALHFLIELALATGVTEGELLSGVQRVEARPPTIDHLSYLFDCVAREYGTEDLKLTIPQAWAFVIYTLGHTMHLLRQRPWRTDDRRTDRKAWVMGMYTLFYAFVRACLKSEISADDLYEAYFAKAKINDARQVEQKI